MGVGNVQDGEPFAEICGVCFCAAAFHLRSHTPADVFSFAPHAKTNRGVASNESVLHHAMRRDCAMRPLSSQHHHRMDLSHCLLACTRSHRYHDRTSRCPCRPSNLRPSTLSPSAGES